jgi:hypothetical protein
MAREKVHEKVHEKACEKACEMVADFRHEIVTHVLGTISDLLLRAQKNVEMAHSKGFEPLTSAFGGQRSDPAELRVQRPLL